VHLSAAGNRFAVHDGFAGAALEDPGALARELCARAEPRLDGLLLLARPAAGGDVRMIVFNADGSRPEACGNGLRCIAKLAVERGHARGPELVVETDAGPRRVRARIEAGRVVAALAHMGTPRLVSLDEPLHVRGELFRVHVVDLGNPHCVLFVAEPVRARIGELGAALERHPRFPARTNVELATVAADGLHARFWERGVGETASSGSGAAAVAAVAIATGRARSSVRVHAPGGTLEVEWTGVGELLLAGEVLELATEETWRSA
jgi:diaminopimelate epimerase